MTGRKTGGAGKSGDGRARASQAEAEAYSQFLDALHGDLDLVSGAGRPPEQRQMLAAGVAAEAHDSPDPLSKVALAVRAARLDPTCLDARLLLAGIGGGPHDELVEELHALVALGEQTLGADFFREHSGNFWHILETRPYMRVRITLARELYRAGRIEASASEYEQMLKLNPNDNNGLRYVLMGIYLESHNLEGVRRLFREYEREFSATFAWGLVLERYLSEDFSGAFEAVQEARKLNAHVEAFLTRQKKPPKQFPPFYSPGEISEALICIQEIGAAWQKYPEASSWLKKKCCIGNLFEQSKKQKTSKNYV